MFKKDSDYALNKHSPNIVYRQADGSRLEVKPGECPDFGRWKDFSNRDFKELDRHDQIEAQGRVTFNDLTDTDTESALTVEDADEQDESAQADTRTIENAMAILEQCLTETQRRRYLLYTYDGKNTRQIAQIEGVSQRTIMESLHESAKKIKIFSKKG
jgi:hypothetical protein